MASIMSVNNFSLVGLLLLTLVLQTRQVNGANILGLFTSSSPSHLIIHMSVVKVLAERGHNITVVCTLKPKVTHERIHYIIVPPTAEQESSQAALLSNMASKRNNMITMISSFLTSMRVLTEVQTNLFQDERFLALYENPNANFDLVIHGYFFNDFQLGVAAKFKCPVIINWSAGPMEMVNNFVGNPRELAYVPTMSIGVKPGETMGFFTRVQNFLSNVGLQFINFAVNSQMQSYYSELFPSENYPTYADMKKNVSLVFCNSDSISEGPIRPNVPSIIEIGGIQIKDQPDPLPSDIAEYLNASKDKGAILFSLGSNLQGSNIPRETVHIIFRVLSSLRQNVIWKWEDLKNTPGQSNNILYKEWLPQDDILAHPNLKLFITHAGKGGITEAQYHGVPMVALPVFADQNGNAQKMATSGYGLQLDMLQLTEAAFRKAVTDVLNNFTYTENVKQFARLYRDRPLTARQKVVFWTEYVIRHHGAVHMQSPLVHLTVIQSHSLDVLASICLVAYIAWRLIKFIVKFAYSKICTKRGNKETKKNDEDSNRKLKKL